jgi:hypothetical protein
MIRRFNYTDRKKISREHIHLHWLESDKEPLRFKLALDLESYSIAPDAQVFVEAYVGSSVMRFDFGIVSNIITPTDIGLKDFGPGLKPLFRIRVVSATADKRVVAWANSISPLDPKEVSTGERSILPVETVDLGPLVWNLRIDSNQFRLQLNSAITQPRDITTMAREPDFIALVYPSIIRQILEHLLLGSEKDSVDAEHDWLKFAVQLTEIPAPTLDEEADDDLFAEEVDEWIEQVILKFCEKHNSLSGFINSKKQQEDYNV